jgi:hypothetical protein
MPTITLYPLGNADCCRIDLQGGEQLLFDYADMRCIDDATDKRIDLATELRKDLKAAKRDYFEVVAFTHLDSDHITGSSTFFHLRHAQKYQGEDRIKINELWVPAFVITEESCTGEAAIIQSEARYRLKQGDGIRVFSRPAKLEKWLNANGLTLASRQHLITDAGQLVPGFSTMTQGVEFFVHSPFATHQNNGTFIDRNDNSLVVQATFLADGKETKLILAADSTYDVLTEIANITKSKKRETRLEWDVFKLPHHCSYLSISPDKGDEKTVPVPDVKWLFENQGRTGAIVVSTSWPIPAKGNEADDDQPPHRQTAAYYRDLKAKLGGEFMVTMEHPSTAAPAPLVIRIDYWGARVERPNRPIGGGAIATPAPRAG